MAEFGNCDVMAVVAGPLLRNRAGLISWAHEALRFVKS